MSFGRKKSLSIDARMLNSSGIGTYIRNLVPLLAGEFDLILYGVEHELYEEDFHQFGNIVHNGKGLYTLGELFFNNKIPSDLIWIPHFNAPLLFRAKVPLVCTIHDTFHLDNPHLIGKFKYLVSYLYFKNAIERADRIITVSNFSKGAITRHFQKSINKVEVVYNGISASKRIENPLEKRGGGYILFVGNVKPHKNLKTLIKAYFDLINAEEISQKLVIVGKKDGFISGDSEINDLVERSSLKDRIEFTGYISDSELSSIYSRANLFVFPSLYEGFGLPPLEAMSYDVPVCASRASSIPEICGDAVDYFDPHSIESMKNSITRVLHNKEYRDQLIFRGRIQFNKYSWELSANRHIEIFNSLL